MENLLPGWKEDLLSSTYYHTPVSDGLSHNDSGHYLGSCDTLGALSGYPNRVNYCYLTRVLDAIGYEHEVGLFNRKLCMSFGSVREKYCNTGRSPADRQVFFENRRGILRDEGKSLVRCDITNALIAVPCGSTTVA